jgi:hypothetical protein
MSVRGGWNIYIYIYIYIFGGGKKYKNKKQKTKKKKKKKKTRPDAKTIWRARATPGRAAPREAGRAPQATRSRHPRRHARVAGRREGLIRPAQERRTGNETVSARRPPSPRQLGGVLAFFFWIFSLSPRDPDPKEKKKKRVVWIFSLLIRGHIKSSSKSSTLMFFPSLLDALGLSSNMRS